MGAAREYPYRRASELSVGHAVRADGPSPMAQIKHGWPYTIAEIQMDDRPGYVRVEGDSTWYRPYLFRGPR